MKRLSGVILALLLILSAVPAPAAGSEVSVRPPIGMENDIPSEAPTEEAELPTEMPAVIASYLPAPGQFVNLPDYGDPDRTLDGSALITLGSFGGNVIYRFSDPIRNDPRHPFGIDFIVIGNCFTNNDKTTSSGAAEPAAVMVSADGEAWYELAGSEYYTPSARHGVTVTYQNGDETFSAAADTPWSDSEGQSGVLPINEYHRQPYFPDPAYYDAFQTGIGKNDTYSAASVSFTGTMIGAGFYPFGYADSHAQADPASGSAVNPYASEHAECYNGDGFDLAWAVDGNGVPAELDEINYVKIYNPVLEANGVFGERSPEICTILRPATADDAVGKTDALTALAVNGEEVPLTDGAYTYPVSAQGAANLTVIPTLSADANIYVSNLRVSSGEAAVIPSSEQVRIIVQEGEKEPLIYFLTVSDVPSPDQIAELASLTLTPGDITRTPDETGALSFTVSNSTASIRLAPAANPGAFMTLRGDSLTDALALADGLPSDSLPLAVGKNDFVLSVTSPDGTITRTYPLSITRREGGSSGGGSNTEDTIKVRFSLSGDTVHYDPDTKQYTGKHTNPFWIKSQTVTVPKGSTVKYLTELMLENADLPYTSSGVYISEINGLQEFDNGPLSGWMYRLNGEIANEGYASRKLQAGDNIQWFYTDDYTKETNYEDFGGSGGGSGGGGSGGASSGGSSESGSAAYTVTFDCRPGSFTQSVKDGEALPRPEDPVREGHTFLGWFTEADGDTAYDFTLPVHRSFTLFAKWAAEESEKPRFTDVPGGAWYADAVRYVCGKGLFQGVSDTLFDPDAPMTRAMLVTVLYRLEAPGAKAPKAPFSDVPGDSWYAEAVNWAAENRIVSGISETDFAPDAYVTREQIAAILYRYAALKSENTDGRAELSRMRDADHVSDWAVDAIFWAVSTGILNGVDENTLAPQKTATRAEVATLMMRVTEGRQE